MLSPVCPSMILAVMIWLIACCEKNKNKTSRSEVIFGSCFVTAIKDLVSNNIENKIYLTTTLSGTKTE